MRKKSRTYLKKTQSTDHTKAYTSARSIRVGQICFSLRTAHLPGEMEQAHLPGEMATSALAVHGGQQAAADGVAGICAAGTVAQTGNKKILCA